MGEKESTASSFIPKDLLDIICILERDEKHSYEIIRNRNNFSLIAEFRAKNTESKLLKNNASVQQTASHRSGQETTFFRSSCVIKSENVEREIFHPGLLCQRSRVNIRTRNNKILPMSGLQNNRSLKRRKPQLKWQGVVPGEKLTGRASKFPES